MVERPVFSWSRKNLLAAVALSAGLLAGCPPVGRPPGPSATRPAVVPAHPGEPAPLLGKEPLAGGIFIPLPTHEPLSGEPLAKATLTRKQLRATLLPVSTTTAPATATAPATTAPATAGAPTTAPDQADPPPLAVKYYLQGRSRYLEGANSEAMDYLEKSLRIDPNAFTVLRLMGRVCYDAGQFARASLYLQRAAARNGDDLEVNYLLSRCYFERKEYATALRYLLAADGESERSATSAFTPLTSFFLGRALQATGYHLAAAEQYADFLTMVEQPVAGYRFDRELAYLMSEEWAVHLAAAENFYVVGRFADALTHYQAAAAESPKALYIQGRIVAAQIHLGRREEAIRRTLKIVDEARGSEDSINLLTWVYRQSGQEARMLSDLRGAAASDQGAALAAARVLEHQGQSDAARGVLAAYLQKSPADLDVLGRYLKLAADQKVYAPAFNAVTAALQSAPDKHAEILRLFDLFSGADVARELLTLPVASNNYSSFLMALVARRADAPDATIERFFHDAITAAPAFWPARESFLSYLLEREKFADARKLIDDALAGKQGGAKPYQMLLEAEVVQQRFASALQLARKAKDDFPDNVELRISLATIYRLRAEYDRAINELSTTINRFPKAETAYRALINVSLQQGNRDLALSTLARMIREMPENRYALILSSQVFLAEGRAAEAEQILQRLQGDHPGDPDIVISLAHIKSAAGKVDEAVKILQDALVRNPQPDALLVEAIARTYLEAEKTDEAIAVTARYAREHPESEALLLLHARMLVDNDRRNDAEAVLRGALEKNPRSEPLAFLLARFLASNERAPEAVTLLEKFIAERGTTVQRLYLLASLLEQSGRSQESQADLQKILTLMPDHSGANNDLGYFWADRGERLAEAEPMIQKALENEPNNAAYLDSLGWLYYKQGKFDRAVAQLEKAVGLLGARGGESEVFTHLGDALYRAGRQSDAVERWKEAQGLLPTKDLTPNEKKTKAYLDKVLKAVGDNKQPPVTPIANK